MIHTDRQRFLFGLGFALVLHTVVFVALAVAGFDFTPYPEILPVMVTLPDYETVPPPEPMEPPPPEPTPTSPDLAPAEPAPVAPTPAEPAPVAPTPAPSAQRAPAPTQPQVGRDAPAGSFSTDDLPWLSDDAPADRRRSSSEDLFSSADPAEATTDLPSWVTAGEFSPQPESSLEEGERENLDAKREADPRFAALLDDVVDALANPNQPGDPGTTAGSSGGTTDGAAAPGDASSTALPGGSGRIEWVGAGSRGPVGELELPRLTARDFRGEVPARVSYVIVFDVNADGIVVPGSLILRQSSGYTQADQKVRRAVTAWTFTPAAAGTPAVTAIALLEIGRDNIR